MTLRDDMVFIPSLGPPHQPTAQVRARQERKLAGTKKRRGVLAKLRAARTMKRRKTRTRRKKSGNRMVNVARGGASSLARGAAARIGGRAIATPIGAVLGALLVAGIVTLRLATGKPLEGTGAMINRMVLGDMDDEARAKMAVRQRFQGDDDLARIRAADGDAGANVQLTSVADDLVKMETRNQVGASLIREAFPVNNIVDMLIVRAKDKWLELWKGEGGPAKLDEVMERVGSHTGGRAIGGGRHTGGR